MIRGNMNKSGKFTLRLSQEQLQFLKALAIEQDRSVSSVIRIMINGAQKNKVRKVRTENSV